MNWETGIDIYTLLIQSMKKITHENITEQHRELYSMLCGDLNGKKYEREGAFVYVQLISLCCTAETNTTL